VVTATLVRDTKVQPPAIIALAPAPISPLGGNRTHWLNGSPEPRSFPPAQHPPVRDGVGGWGAADGCAEEQRLSGHVSSSSGAVRSWPDGIDTFPLLLPVELVL